MEKRELISTFTYQSNEKEMEERVNLEEISEKEGIELIETTSEMSGYPSHLRKALLPETWEQAKSVAEKYGLEMRYVTRKYGWNLWYRNSYAHEPYDMLGVSYGNDDTVIYEKSENTKECLTDMLKEDISNCDTFDEIKKVYERYDEIFDKLEDCDDNELIVVQDGDYSETIERFCIGYCEELDSKQFCIALFEPIK